MVTVEERREQLHRALSAAGSAAAEWYDSVRDEARQRLGEDDRLRLIRDDTVSSARAVMLNLMDALDAARQGVSR